MPAPSPYKTITTALAAKTNTPNDVVTALAAPTISKRRNGKKE